MNKKNLFCLILILFILGCQTPYQQLEEQREPIENNGGEPTKTTVKKESEEFKPETKTEEMKDTKIYITESSKVGSIYVSKIEKQLANDGSTLLKIFAKANNYINKAKIRDIEVGGIKPAECRPTIGNYVQFINSEGYIFCRFNGNVNGFLTINLDYESQGEASVSFLQGSPPSQVNRGDFFEVSLSIKNLGPGTIKKGECKVELDGIWPEDWNKKDSDFIKFVDEDIKLGESTTIKFTELKYEGLLFEDFTFPLIIDYSCGKSKGKIETSILIKYTT